MASWADRVDWGRLIQMALLVAGGVGALALGQVPLGAMLITAAVAQQVPNNILGAVKKLGGPKPQ